MEILFRKGMEVRVLSSFWGLTLVEVVSQNRHPLPNFPHLNFSQYLDGGGGAESSRGMCRTGYQFRSRVAHRSTPI